MTTFVNNAAPTVPTFDSLLAKMLPHFKHYARKYSRSKRIDRQDVIQDLIGLALQIYNSAVRRGKESSIYYTPLMQWAIKRYREGRRCRGYNSTDILSEHTQMLGRSEVHSFHDGEREDRHHCMEDRRVNVADAVQFKIDFADWYEQQSERDKRIITDLSRGERTGDVARKYGVSDGLISQYRKRYRNSWDNFIGGTHEPA